MTPNPTVQEPRFLTLEEVLSLHESAIDTHGGSYGVRDQGLLESALAAPRQRFGGQYAYAFPHEMAAAYLFHLCKNHAFIDGNKRIAWVAMVFFMRVNGWNVLASEQDAIDAVLDVATDKRDKPAITTWLQQYSRPRIPFEPRELLATINLREVESFLGRFMAATGDSERIAAVNEAQQVIPLLREVWDEVTGNGSLDQAQLQRYIGITALLLTIHRHAEDMGYEW